MTASSGSDERIPIVNQPRSVNLAARSSARHEPRAACWAANRGPPADGPRCPTGPAGGSPALAPHPTPLAPQARILRPWGRQGGSARRRASASQTRNEPCCVLTPTRVQFAAPTRASGPLALAGSPHTGRPDRSDIGPASATRPGRACATATAQAFSLGRLAASFRPSATARRTSTGPARLPPHKQSRHTALRVSCAGVPAAEGCCCTLRVPQPDAGTDARDTTNGGRQARPRDPIERQVPTLL